MDRHGKRQFTFSGAYLLFALALMWLYAGMLASKGVRQASFSEVVMHLENGDVSRLHVSETELRAVTELPDERDSTQTHRVLLVAKRVPGVDNAILAKTLEEHPTEVVGNPPEQNWWTPFLYWIPFLLIIFGPYLLGMKMIGRSGPLNLGRAKAKLYDENAQNKTTFDDVAGVDEAEEELQEVVRFLEKPSEFARLGAKAPKGILLVGPPGTGKTLLARAVAGEAGVPFFSISGSEFVEMFVGVGAARVRQLFEEAQKKAPCIIFIDEIDAIGRSRGGVGGFGTNEEREQTLNQLLTEMDGFDSASGVVIMAATNRPEVLDQALVRAGRFDRQVVVDAPDLKGRRAILEVHTRSVPLGDDVDLDVIAQRTPGMVGADLAKLVNEAALAAARRGSERVQQIDFEEAVDRIQLGLKRKGRAMSEDERRRVAYHEGGHTLVALSVEHADPVHRVSIIPRTIGALGVTLQLPTEDRYLMTKAELEDRIAVMLGGRTAEELVFGEVSTGAQNDLERATETARQMVCRFGMSDTLGPVTYGRPVGLRFLDAPAGLGEERNYSEKRAQEIDEEVSQIIERQLERAREVLSDRHAQLEAIAQGLLEKETLERADLDRIVRG